MWTARVYLWPAQENRLLSGIISLSFLLDSFLSGYSLYFSIAATSRGAIWEKLSLSNPILTPVIQWLGKKQKIDGKKVSNTSYLLYY